LLIDQLTDPFYHSFLLPIALFSLLFLAYPMECLVSFTISVGAGPG
jgi:hypothetical protein